MCVYYISVSVSFSFKSCLLIYRDTYLFVCLFNIYTGKLCYQEMKSILNTVGKKLNTELNKINSKNVVLKKPKPEKWEGMSW